MTNAQTEWMKDADEMAKARADVVGEAAVLIQLCKPGLTNMEAVDASICKMRKLSAKAVSKAESFAAQWTADGKRIKQEETSPCP